MADSAEISKWLEDCSRRFGVLERAKTAVEIEDTIKWLKEVLKVTLAPWQEDLIRRSFYLKRTWTWRRRG